MSNDNQNTINQMQALYRQWLEILPRLEQAQQDWQNAVKILKQLEQFYFEGEYMQLHQAIEAGLDVDLRTEGEYSIMSEDALWNAFCDKEQLLWQMLRFSAAHLDKFSESATDDEKTADPN